MKQPMPCVLQFSRATAYALGLGLSWMLAACGGGGDQEEAVAPTPSAVVSPATPAGSLAVKLAAMQQPLADSSMGLWSPLMELSLVPVAAANLPDGKILMWSASTQFDVGPGGMTYTTLFDPLTGAVTEERVDQTGHDMFCPGTSNLSDGTLLVSGGFDSARTSRFDAITGRWVRDADMRIPRGYQSNTVLSDGSVLTLGGSWSGGMGGKHGEIWSASTGWRRLPGVPVDPALAADPTGGVYRSDNHMWLLSAPNGKVLHAGPSSQMNWINPQGKGSMSSAGLRGDDAVALNGNVAMYDIGKILKAGGGPRYDNVNASAAAYVMDVNVGVSVRKVPAMAYPRIFSTAVVLPNGEVMVSGGQTVGKAYSDDFSVLPAELWNPVTERFTVLPAMSVGRNYHSVSLLLPDGRVMVGGSGLCGEGCAGNHANIQIYTPHYLLNADGSLATRPAIQTAPPRAVHGTSILVSTDVPVSSFALMRLSSTTHTVNNDQRRIPLRSTPQGGTSYELAIPSNPGVVLPGFYMLFALDDRGVPSVSKMIRITGDDAPVLGIIDNPSSAVGSPTALGIEVINPGVGPVRFAASGLPAGLSMQADTGVISGTPTQAGQYSVLISATNNVSTTSTQTLWTVEEGAAQGVSFVRLTALNANAGAPVATMAEFHLLDGNAEVLSRAGWTASSGDSSLGMNPNAALDRDPNTYWQVQVPGSTTAPTATAHSLVVHLGGPRVITGFKYLAPSNAALGKISQWRMDTSRDGVNWTQLAQGNLADLGFDETEKVVYFNNIAQNKPAVQGSTQGGSAALAVDGNIGGRTTLAGSVSQTNAGAENWWQVDLGSAQGINAVRIWHPTDCCLGQVNLVVLTSATESMVGQTLTSLLNNPAVRSTVVSMEGALQTTLRMPQTARYLRIQRQEPEALALALAEVQVFASSGNHAPTFAPVASPQSVVGEALTWAISARDPDGDPVTYSARGLPVGLGIAPDSGLVSGRPAQLGTFDVEVLATDSQGARSELRFAWRVEPAPVVDVPLPNPPAVLGAATTLNAGTAPAPGVTYQWVLGDGNTSTSLEPQLQYTYSAPGLYAVQVSIVSAGRILETRSFTKAIYAPTTPTSATHSSSVAWEARGGAPARIWMVNPDNDSVSVFSDASLERLAEVPTGKSPQSVAIAPDGRIWVVNKGSANISIIDPASLQVAQTISLARASRPHGLAFAPDGSGAHVALEALGQLQTLHPLSGQTLNTLAVGQHARHVAVAADSTRMLVSRFITAPLPGENTATVQTQVLGQPRGAEVWALRLAAGIPVVERSVVLRNSDKSDGSAQGRGVPNYLGAPVMAPDGRSAWVPSKQDNIVRGSLRDGQPLDFQNSVRAVSSRINLATLSEDYPARVDHDNASLASAAVFHPTGAYLFVALQTSRQFAVLDPVRHVELMRVETGLAPDGLAVSRDGQRLYVNNFMGRRLATYDLNRLVQYGELQIPQLASTVSVTVDKLHPTVLAGKQLFYDARDTRLARDAYMSCASCHSDGGHDGRTWDFTSLGEGLRNTISLRGRAKGHGPLHWSGNFDEVQDFEGQIRSLAGGTGLMSDTLFTGNRRLPLGDKKAGLSADLDALAAYVASLDEADESPYRAPDASLTPQGQLGKVVYTNHCASCHSGRPFTDSALNNLHNVGTLRPASGQRLNGPLQGIDTPTLRDVWFTAPYLHDGSALTLDSAVAAHGMQLASNEASAVVAYIQQLGREETSRVMSSGTGLSAHYFSNPQLLGAPAYATTQGVHFNWEERAPAAQLPSDGFSVRWSGTIEAPVTGTYRLRTLTDDGVRVWVDGQLLIDDWSAHAVTTHSGAPLRWEAGERHSITMEYQELGGLAVAQMEWQLPGAATFSPVPVQHLYANGFGSGLQGAYFDNPALQGRPRALRTEAVNFVWSAAPIGVPGLPADNFSVRWSGEIEAPVFGTYALQTVSDDGVRVWIDGQLMIDHWSPHGPSKDTTLPLVWSPGQRHTITVEYQEVGGQGTAQLLWQLPGQPNFTVIPQEHLYPVPGTGLRGSYFANAQLQGVPVAERTEAVHFHWLGSPGPRLPADGFSVRWSGFIEAPRTGEYLLQTLSDDGVRLWINGALVINHWTSHGPSIDTAGGFRWTAGERHAIVVEYQETGGPGTAQLLWRMPNSAESSIVPAQYLYPGR